jgi:hypothetical protein
MADSRFLEHEVALLLAKYGTAAVLDALARKLQLSLEQLQAMLQDALNHHGPTTRSKGRRSSVDLVAKLAQAHPDKAEFLRDLHVHFGNRTFLPELRDVRRFLEGHDVSIAAMKSRVDALPRVLRLLADLEIVELQELCNPAQEAAYSSLGVISDEILRHDR